MQVVRGEAEGGGSWQSGGIVAGKDWKFVLRS